MSEAYGYSQGRVLLENLSSFWTRLFQDPDVIQAHLHGQEETLAQAYFDLLEIIAAKSVIDIPVFHREKWTLVVFNESDRNKNASSLLKYGPSIVYGPQPADSENIADHTYQYGGFISGEASSFMLPKNMVNVESYICNRIHEPSVILTAGEDFFVQNGVIFFAKNPFQNDLLPIRDVVDTTGKRVDRQLALWFLNSDHDRQFLFTYYGSLVGCFFESSENYKQFLQAVFRLFTVGPRINFLLSTLNALVGLPVIREAIELFVKIESLDGGTQRVVTNKNIYDFDEKVILRRDLIEGLELQAFEHLTEAIEIVDDIVQPEWWNSFAFLPLPPEVLSQDHSSSLKVFNDLVKIKGEWGATTPIKAIGEMTDARKQFYEHFPLLWGTGAIWGEATFDFRPLDLLFELYFKYNLFLLFIHLDQIPAGKLTSKLSDLLGEALPAYVHFLNVLEQPFVDDYNLSIKSTDDIDLERAHAYSDDYTLTSSGFYGLPRWGGGDSWGAPSYATEAFLVGPRFFKLERSCV